MGGRNWSCAHRLEEHPKFAAVTRQVSLVYHQQADTPVARSGHVTGESLAPVRVHLTPCCTVEVEEEECVLLGLKKGRENGSLRASSSPEMTTRSRTVSSSFYGDGDILPSKSVAQLLSHSSRPRICAAAAEANWPWQSEPLQPDLARDAEIK